MWVEAYNVLVISMFSIICFETYTNSVIVTYRYMFVY